MKFFVKKLSDKFSGVILALIAACLITACTASKNQGETGSQGGAKQSEEINVNNKKAENKSNAAEKPAEKLILWDFRKSNYSKQQDFPKAETDAVLKYLLETDSWDKDLAITNRLQGAFTKAGAKETLYYVSGCKDESGKFVSNATCGHVGWDSAAWIAIYDGTTPVLKIEQPLGYAVEKVTDVNGDGKNEFSSFSGYGQSGIQYSGITIGQISDGKYEMIKDFKGYADNCGFGDAKSDGKLSARAAVISYAPKTDGKIPEFIEEYFQGRCKNGEVDKSSWKKTDKKNFDDFFDSVS